ncbi:MAG: aminopeptidase P family protein [candidate division KSB1 bacterium]|nr:aminopeptidase P family protein [candidate division KSB1 bacterium]MDZ7319530.1 aminopeptidase P family protein [candidate division KSB1 bacterium]MDZ7341158.1 aminopeptidase P family protein [candidate division KSB1 bacterium]
MFDKEIYEARRKKLKEQISSGLILFLGNDESPMNYGANTFHFRQDSSFLYFFGLDFPGLAAVIDIDNDREIIFGYDFTVDDMVWMGPQEKLAAKAEKVGVGQVEPTEKLAELIPAALKQRRKIHFLPQYRPENLIKIETLTGIRHDVVNDYASAELIKAVVAQRSIKSDAEVKEIELALEISRDMYDLALKLTKPGIYEHEVYGQIEGLLLSRGSAISFPIILTVRGEVLHGHSHANRMKEGDLLVLDSGAESPLHYASDITRTYPVTGKFTPLQKEIYSVVLNAQLEAIRMMKPGVLFRDVHLHAARVIADGLKQLNFMKGNLDDAIKEGAHALFFPHGLGHQLGLDVHDMEGLGENFVGYNANIQRSQQFGLAYLRFAKELQPGHVLTVEPGIYFMPELIRQWKTEKKHAQFINYDKVERTIGFGGIRIEDDVLVTAQGHRVLGSPIPKAVPEIEKPLS